RNWIRRIRIWPPRRPAPKNCSRISFPRRLPRSSRRVVRCSRNTSEPSATILFADFKGFILLAERMEPVALIGLLDQYFSAFDEIVTRLRLEKLKTIGDAYMA